MPYETEAKLYKKFVEALGQQRPRRSDMAGVKYGPALNCAKPPQMGRETSIRKGSKRNGVGQ